ncbi:hypothetical protein GCM10020369_83760 [Cryptosporangium minutisporangium]|uniref:Uncharacterized protein n=1 Tax=Cryptosporangium minutisporangium TaxID=113569 RepID=A0ABP6TD72_9ACTN
MHSGPWHGKRANHPAGTRKPRQPAHQPRVSQRSCSAFVPFRAGVTASAANSPRFPDERSAPMACRDRRNPPAPKDGLPEKPPHARPGTVAFPKERPPDAAAGWPSRKSVR